MKDLQDASRLTPSQLSVNDQAALYHEIERKLSGDVTWKQIADELGFPQRTLEYFRRSWAKREANRDSRVARAIAVHRLGMRADAEQRAADPFDGLDLRRILNPEQLAQMVYVLERLDQEHSAREQEKTLTMEEVYAKAIAMRKMLFPYVERLREQGFPLGDFEHVVDQYFDGYFRASLTVAWRSRYSKSEAAQFVAEAAELATTLMSDYDVPEDVAVAIARALWLRDHGKETR